MKIVIIEDERITANDLAKTIISIEPATELLATLPSVEEAIPFLKNNTGIDLIFSDIQLGDGLSFEIFEQTKNLIPVIFCTAFNEYALQAFKSMGIDYLLKPFTKETVCAALEKYHQLKGKPTPTIDFVAMMDLLKNQLTPPKTTSVIIQQGDKIIPLEVNTIALFYSENENTYAFTFDQRKLLVSQTLETLESSFTPTFFRASRQFLVNRKAIKDASHSFNRKVSVNLNVPFKEQILVGKLKVTTFLNWLAN